MQKENIDGILLFNKNVGKTSFQAINEIKKKLNIKKIGHSGTLDKDASGLLLVGLGKSCRILKHLVGMNKKYIAEFYFGKQTSTDDKNGKIINFSDTPVELERIEKYLKDFSGIIKQIPPDFSAIHVNGKRAYQLANAGKKPEIKPREIEISSIKTLGFDAPILKLEIECSSGTYVRAIARDLGIKTGYFAHLHSLERVKIGNFNLKNSYNIEDIISKNYKIISAYETLDIYQPISVKKEYVEYIKNGRKIDKNWFYDIKEEQIKDNFYRIHVNKKLLALVKVDNGKIIYDIVY